MFKIYLLLQLINCLVIENILIGYLVDLSLLILTENSKHKKFETYAAIYHISAMNYSKNMGNLIE